MQIALHNIREIGYKKIYMYFKDLNILEDIKSVNSDLYDYNTSSYSFLNNWTEKTYNLLSLYKGFCDLVDTYTPLIDNVGVDTITKRKFRNTWGKIWKNIAKDLKLSDEIAKILEDCGIRLASYLIDESTNFINNSTLLNVLDFYNAFLKWSIFTEKELNFKKNELTHITLLEKIALSDSNEFNIFVKELV